MSLPLKHIEELSLTHWPALNTEYMDGWKLRMSNGYTKRANCISTIQSSSKQLHANIAACEQRYKLMKQPTIFKLTPFSEPELDETLNSLDYALYDPSLMLTLSLDQLKDQPSIHASLEGQLEFIIQEHISLPWLEKYCKLSGVNDGYIPTMIDMMAAMPGKLMLASCYVDGEPAALAMAIIDQDYVGIYDVITAEAYRNKGLCSYMLWQLLQQCKPHASKSYLAVVADNEPAKRVYAKLGYQEAYTYWYRVKA